MLPASAQSATSAAIVMVSRTARIAVAVNAWHRGTILCTQAGPLPPQQGRSQCRCGAGASGVVGEAYQSRRPRFALDYFSRRGSAVWKESVTQGSWTRPLPVLGTPFIMMGWTMSHGWRRHMLLAEQKVTPLQMATSAVHLWQWASSWVSLAGNWTLARLRPFRRWWLWPEARSASRNLRPGSGSPSRMFRLKPPASVSHEGVAPDCVLIHRDGKLCRCLAAWARLTIAHEPRPSGSDSPHGAAIRMRRMRSMAERVNNTRA